MHLEGRGWRDGKTICGTCAVWRMSFSPCPVFTLPDAILQEFFSVHFQYSTYSGYVTWQGSECVGKGKGGEGRGCGAKGKLWLCHFIPSPSFPPTADRSSNTSLLRCPLPSTVLRRALWRHYTDLTIQVGNMTHRMTSKLWHHMTCGNSHTCLK